MKKPHPIVAQLQEEFPQAVQEAIDFLDELTLVVDCASVVDVCTFLRDNPALIFNYLCDVSAVDVWPEQPRFEVNVHLLSIPTSRPSRPHGDAKGGPRRLRVKVRLEERDARMPTLTGVWPPAAWHEREIHDLFGIDFVGHPDMRPLLLPDDWDAPPPLRRDGPEPVQEVAFSFNQERVFRDKPCAKE